MLASSGEITPPLRRSRDRLAANTFLHHTCFKPLTDQLDNPPVGHPRLDVAQQPLVVDGVKVAADVQLQNPSTPFDERFPDALQRLSRAPLRPVAVRRRQKVGLEDRLQHQLRRLLRHPVPDRRYAQRPHAAIWLRDAPPPHWRRVVATCSERVLEVLEHPLHTCLLYTSDAA